MNPITELVPPQTQTLTSLARVKRELRIAVTDTDNDVLLRELILEASAAIVKVIGYAVLRAHIREHVVGWGRSELMLTRTPIAQIDSVVIDGTTVDPDNYAIAASIGVLLHDTIWENTRHQGLFIDPFESPMEGKHSHVVDYWAGVFGPDDDVATPSGISVDGTLERFDLPNPPLLVSGELVVTAGFTSPANNGAFVVQSRDDAGVAIIGDLTTETAPAAPTMTVRTLDRGLERLVVQTVKAWFFSSRHDPSITSEKIGEWSASYGSGVEVGEIPQLVMNSLNKWCRIV